MEDSYGAALAQFDNLDYIAERARQHNKDIAELHTIIGSLMLFISGESDDSLPELGWVDEEDYVIIAQDPKVIAAQEALEKSRHTASMERARELSRCNEWHALFERFIAPLSARDAA